MNQFINHENVFNMTTTEHYGVKYIPVQNDDISSYIHKKYLKNMNMFKLRNEITVMNIERNELAYALGRMGVLVTVDDEESSFFSIDFVFNNEEGEWGEFSFAIPLNLENSKFDSFSGFGGFQLFFIDDDLYNSPNVRTGFIQK